MRSLTIFAPLAALLACTCSPVEVSAQSGVAHGNQDWSSYGGSPEGNHYSTLSQINRHNVKELQLAWSFDTGEQGGLQSSPLIIDGVLFGITPTQNIFAVDATNGKLIWKFDSGVAGTQPDRGLAYWSDGAEKRVLVGVMNFVYALDAKTGKPTACLLYTSDAADE